VRWLGILLLIGLAACGRPLAEGERAMAADMFGDSLELDRIRVKSGFRGAPSVEDPVLPTSERPSVTPGLCDRVAPSTEKSLPGAWVLYNTVHFAKLFYRPDTARDWPNQIIIPHLLILGHELVHVWQWQNRKLTGYRPMKAALEALLNRDPYFYVPEPGAGFLEYGYEQQGALLEDYLCYAVFDPENARRQSLRDILSPYFQMDRIDEILIR
jgi:hypothetical protein